MNVIFFDGVCGLCNGFIDFVMKIDKEAKFKFSPLQSEYAKSVLPSEYVADLDSVVVQIDGKTLRKSKAVFAVLKKIGGVWGMVSVVGALPEGFLNRAYDMVAENRYKIFGKKETCRLPTPEERARFVL
jgi:predicted DCC family thiol-disulfide oxidoreductase YuxK